jgi:parallel beta-helix repeat protein
MLLAGASLLNSAVANPYNVPQRAANSYYIEVDGSITPTTAPIKREGNLYSLTDDIQGHPIWIQCSNIVFDGAGFTLKGTGWESECGLTVNCTTNVTVKNLVVQGFYNGIMVQRELGPANSANPYPISRGTIVSDCTVWNMSRRGIFVWSSSDNKIARNNVTGCHESGLNVWDNTDDVVTGNELSQNNVQNCNIGIDADAAQNRILNNTVTNNSEYGIQLMDRFSGNTVSGNYLSDNKIGIFVDFSKQNTITENTLIHNTEFGMQLKDEQEANLIYRNNFLENGAGDTLQVSIPGYLTIDQGTTVFHPGRGNQWNHASEGNYWSDYGTRYPNASELSGAGFGDTPYFINENNIDHYPLLHPVGNVTNEPTPKASPTPPTTTPPRTPEQTTALDSTITPIVDPIQSDDYLNLGAYALAVVVAVVAALAVLLYVKRRLGSKGS